MNIVYLSILSNVLIINDSIAFKYHIYKIKILSKAQTFIVYLSILSNNIALKRIFSILITREITDMTPTQRPRIRIQWMVKRGPLKVGRASVEVMQTYVYFSTIRISLMLCKMELCSVLHRWT